MLGQTRFKYSLNAFKETGLVLTSNETRKQFELRKQALIHLEQETKEIPLTTYFERILNSTSPNIQEVLTQTNNGTTNIEDGTAELKDTLKYFLNIPNLILPVKVANSYQTKRSSRGAAFPQSDNSNLAPFIILKHEGQPNTWNTEEFLEQVLLKAFEHKDFDIYPFWADGTPEFIKFLIPYFEKNKNSFAYNILCSQFLDPHSSQLHEGIHVMHYLNGNYNSEMSDLDNIILEASAFKLSADLHINKILTNINSKHEIYAPAKLIELKKELFSLNSTVTKFILLANKEYNPYLRKLKKIDSTTPAVDFPDFDADEFVTKKNKKNASTYTNQIKAYISALDNLTTLLLNSGKPIQFAMHETMSLTYDEFVNRWSPRVEIAK